MTVNRVLIEIREARPDDCESIAGLARELGYKTRSEDVQRRLTDVLNNPDHRIFVADNSGKQITGFIHIYRNLHIETDHIAEIGALVVSLQLRGTGIGRQLLESAAAWSAEQNLRTIRCRNHNSDASGFFLRIGFRQLNPQLVFVYHLPA
jgi:N-acetylglutamate synthase-like GNAT family acetyltransferase